MARLPDSFVQRVADATDIVELVGQYVALTKRGREFVGLCPFHDDHRPSLNVSPSKQIFKCFVCGAGGGAFQFLMHCQKMTFPEAVRHLADRAGIAVPRLAPTLGEGDRSLSREALLKLTAFAARFYRQRLNGPEGAAALAYARSRQLTDESIERFALGYAPDAWEALSASARKAGFTDRQLAAAGLVASREDGSGYDRLRNRLVFPILDVTGQVIAFGGRALDEGEGAKYLNTAESVLFDKSANLYALNWSRPGIVQSGRAVVVEGYFDALMCLQAGLEEVVATLGTALTERHVRTLARYAREAVLVFDADTAGQTAAQRAIELFLSQRLHVRVATVPSAATGPEGAAVKDPCDYVLAAGADAMRSLLAGAPDALEYAWGRRRDEYHQAQTLPQKRQVVEEFLRLVVASSSSGAIDALRQGLLANRLAELVGLSPTDVAEQMRRIAARLRRSGPPGGQRPAGELPEGTAAAERSVLGVLICEGELFQTVRDRLAPAMFSRPDLRVLAERVWDLAGEGRLELSALLAMDEGEHWGGLVTELQTSAERRGNYGPTLADAVRAILARRKREELELLKARPEADAAEVMRRVAEEARKPDRRRMPRLS